jgi:hypothetical protein
MLSTSQGKNLRKLSQNNIAFLITSNDGGDNAQSPRQQTLVNYLIKMKSDTSHFSTLGISRYFNFCDKNRSDPFLITAGLASQARNLAVGSGATAM